METAGSDLSLVRTLVREGSREEIGLQDTMYPIPEGRTGVIPTGDALDLFPSPQTFAPGKVLHLGRTYPPSVYPYVRMVRDRWVDPWHGERVERHWANIAPMELPLSWAVFPLYPVLPGGVCGCGRPCTMAGKHPSVKWSEVGKGEKVPIPEGYGRGLCTGERSGVIVIDLDRRPDKGIDGLAALQALGEVPNTLTVLTPSGGFHLYYRWPGFRVPNSASRLGPGIDIRGDGGMVVIPDSMHRNGGTYKFLDEEKVIAALAAGLI